MIAGSETGLGVRKTGTAIALPVKRNRADEIIVNIMVVCFIFISFSFNNMLII